MRDRPKWKQQTRREQVATRPRVILAEDDDELRTLLSGALRRDGYEVTEARNGRELRALVGAQITGPNSPFSVDLVITDIRMPGPSGLRVLEELRSREWNTPLMVISAFGDASAYDEARRLGVTAVFDKPFDLDDFRTAVLNLVDPSAAS